MTSCQANPQDAPVAVITGSAAPRVGRSIALHFANHHYRIVVHGHRSAQEGEELVKQLASGGQDAMLIRGPVDDETTVKGWVDAIQERMGRIDVLIHAAAIWEPKRLEETAVEDLQHFLQVNLIGSFLCAKHFGLAMTQQPQGGSIVLMGDWAIERPYVDFSAYFLSKGSIPTLTRTMAVELASRNPKVRVNAIHPGPVMLYEGASDTLREKVRRHSLLQRDGAAWDIAEAALFLSQQAFITGTCLPVEGGRTIYSPNDDEAIAHPSR